MLSARLANTGLDILLSCNPIQANRIATHQIQIVLLLLQNLMKKNKKFLFFLLSSFMHIPYSLRKSHQSWLSSNPYPHVKGRLIKICKSNQINFISGEFEWYIFIGHIFLVKKFFVGIFSGFFGYHHFSIVLTK